MSKRRNKNSHYDTSHRSMKKFTAREIEEALYENDSETTAQSKEPAKPIVLRDKIYVLDTNILIACPDIIYDPKDPDWEQVEEAKPNFANSQIIIPITVLMELDHQKSELSLRGLHARVVIDHIAHQMANSGRTIEEVINFKKPVTVGYLNQTLSILPVPKAFNKFLPVIPDANDKDGWIVVTALYAQMVENGLDIFSESEKLPSSLPFNDNGKQVILVTNDTNCTNVAETYGVKTTNFSYKHRTPYVGCRELVVPDKLFKAFYFSKEVSIEDFKRYMPNERDLIPNEFLYLSPKSGRYPNTFEIDESLYPHVARFDAKEQKLVRLVYEHAAPGHPKDNPGIATMHDSLCNPAIMVVIVDGVAGSGKTFTAAEWAIDAIHKGEYKKCVIITSKSAKLPTGAIPGGLEEKLKPIVAYIYDAVESYVSELPEFREMRKLLRKFGDDGFKYVYSNQHEKNDLSGGKPEVTLAGRSFPKNGRGLDLYDENEFLKASDYGTTHSKKKQKRKNNRQKDQERKARQAEEERQAAENMTEKMSYSSRLEERVRYYIDRYFEVVPYELVQGRSFRDCIVIFDESQRVHSTEAETIQSRPGKHCKYIYLGDVKQIEHSDECKAYQNCLENAKRQFVGWEGCSIHRLTVNMRSETARIATRDIDERKVARLLGNL